jgi:hypothetical protein
MNAMARRLLSGESLREIKQRRKKLLDGQNNQVHLPKVVLTTRYIARCSKPVAFATRIECVLGSDRIGWPEGSNTLMHQSLGLEPKAWRGG